MDLQTLLIVYGVFGLVCGLFSSFVAGEKGYFAGWWFVWGLLFGPTALFALAGLPNHERGQ